MEENGEQHSLKDSELCDILKVHVQLPTGETGSFQVDRTSSVRDLKMLVEVNSGVPSDLFTLVYNKESNNNLELQEDTKMAELDVQASMESIVLDLNIPLWWQRFVDRCMKRDKHQIFKRIWIKMNQISSEERAFVATFIAAQKGDSDLFQSLLKGDIKVDVEQSVQCSGRTLLHAAVVGGNFSCAVALFMNKGWTLLGKADQQGITPLEMAKNMNQQGFYELLSKYVELKSQQVAEDVSVLGKLSDIIGSEPSDSRTDERNKENGRVTCKDDEQKTRDSPLKSESIETSVKSEAGEYQGEEHRVEYSQMVERDQKKDKSVSLHQKLNRASSLKLKLHTPLRNCRSFNGEDRPMSPLVRPVCVEKIIPLSDNACAPSGVKPNEQKLPRVSTPTSSPMNSPRMGRRLIPSPLNGLVGDRPASPILRPRTPTSPRPMSPHISRSRSPSSPVPRRAFRFPATPENLPQRTRAMSLHGGESGDNRLMSRQMHDFLMSHYDSRETKPWNAWRVIKKNQLDQFDVSDEDDSSSEDEDERLQRYLQKSGRRQTFEMWLNDKEAQMVKQQTLLAEKAKKEAASKEKEALQRQGTRKTYEEWIKEKDDFKQEDFVTGKTADSEQTEARKAEAFRRYQKWLRAKDEEALAREDQLRREAAAKFSKTQEKRDEKMKFAWFKRKTRE